MLVEFNGQPIVECWYCGHMNPCRPDKWNGRPACESCWHQVAEETRGWRKIVETEGMNVEPGEVAAHIRHAAAIRAAGAEVQSRDQA